MVENIVCALDNLASDASLHGELIAHGLLDVVRRFVDLFLCSTRTGDDGGADDPHEGIELLSMPTGSLKLIKAVASLMMKLSQEPHIQAQCIELGMLDLVQTCLAKFSDYEVHTKLYTAVGCFAACGLNATGAARSGQFLQYCAEIRAKAADAGCVQLLIYGSESSEFFKIRRICSQFLSLL